MIIKELKNIMKQINDPNEFQLSPINLTHSLYWIWSVNGVRLKPIYSKLVSLRVPENRWDVFVNGQYITPIDYIYVHKGSEFIIKFKKSNFAYQLDENDVIKIKGDLELV
jgi:hypothetical protein